MSKTNLHSFELSTTHRTLKECKGRERHREAPQKHLDYPWRHQSSFHPCQSHWPIVLQYWSHTSLSFSVYPAAPQLEPGITARVIFILFQSEKRTYSSTKQRTQNLSFETHLEVEHKGLYFTTAEMEAQHRRTLLRGQLECHSIFNDTDFFRQSGKGINHPSSLRRVTTGVLPASMYSLPTLSCLCNTELIIGLPLSLPASHEV